MKDKIKILFLAANPVDTSYRLRLDEEIREIDKKLRIGTEREAFELVSAWAVRAGDLMEALLWHRPHIVHFSGHGKESDGIALEDGSGNTKLVSKEALGRLFSLHKDNIRVVVLNACYSQNQVSGFSKAVDYTIGMKTVIGDKTAIIFAAHFYQALGFGEPVKAAFDRAITQIMLEGISEFETPALIVRDGVNTLERFLADSESLAPTSVRNTDQPGSKIKGSIVNSGGHIENAVIQSGAKSIFGHNVNQTNYDTHPGGSDRASSSAGEEAEREKKNESNRT